MLLKFKVKFRQKGFSSEDEFPRKLLPSLYLSPLQAGRKNIESQKRQIGELKREKDILDRKHTSSDRAASLMYDLSKVGNKRSIIGGYSPGES